MELQKVTVILFADLVTGKDDHVLGIISLNKGDVLINSICRSLIPVRTACFLVGRKNMYTSVKTIQIPGLSVPYVLIQYHWLVLCQNTNRINSRIHTV